MLFETLFRMGGGTVLLIHKEMQIYAKYAEGQNVFCNDPLTCHKKDSHTSTHNAALNQFSRT